MSGLERYCSRCRTVKPVDEFSPRNTWCKQCQRNYRAVRRAKMRAGIIVASPKQRLDWVRSSAKRRGIECSLDVHDMFQLTWNKRCSYCLGPLSPTGAGVDRIDNAVGYHRSNCKPCCGDCNYARGKELTSDEFNAVIKARLRDGWSGWTKK